MLQQIFGQPNIMDLYWTLQIELVFYVLCVVAFRIGFLQNNRKRFAISFVFLGLALLMASIKFATSMKLPIAFPLALSIMFWGSILRAFRISKDKEARLLSPGMLH